MLPAGFLGTRGDVLMDLVILSFIVILPVLLFSWRTVRHRGYALHRKVQLALAITLAVAVLLFEVDLRLSGGVFTLIEPSPYANDPWMIALVYGHTLIAVATAILWAALIWRSLKRFPNPPMPGDFSATHRAWGRAGMIMMIVTGLTAYPLYYFGFAV